MTQQIDSIGDRISEFTLSLSDGGVLHVYDAGSADDGALALLWHHGTPNTGAPPAPLLDAAAAMGLRWIGYDRPGYGGSSPAPDRPVYSAAGYAEAVVDFLGIERFAVMGHSGGGPHALAVAAMLPMRVVAAVAIASLAPLGRDGLEPEAYTAGMAATGIASLTAAIEGRTSKESYEKEHGDDYDPEFTPGDLAMFEGEWSWFIDVVRAGAASGPAPAIDDDLAYVRDWGFDPASIQAPTLLLHGGADRVVPPAHSQRLAESIPGAELRLEPSAGHISVIDGAIDALAWIARQKD